MKAQTLSRFSYFKNRVKMLTMVASLVVSVSPPVLAGNASHYKVLAGNLVQGGYIVLELTPNATLKYKNRLVKADSKGRVIMAFSRDDKPVQYFEEITAKGKLYSSKLNIKQRQYNVQKINGLPKNKVTPDTKTRDKIWTDIKKARKARKINLATPYFESGFTWPAKGIISGVYGSQRVLNGKPRRPHFGVDVAAPKGAPLYAPADGQITLVENMELSGNTIMIDHGYGLRSTVMHLSKTTVKNGDIVRKGQQIGEVGMTGRATGPHVHWGMSWFNVRLDPALSIQPNTKPGDKVRD